MLGFFLREHTRHVIKSLKDGISGSFYVDDFFFKLSSIKTYAYDCETTTTVPQ